MVIKQSMLRTYNGFVVAGSLWSIVLNMGRCHPRGYGSNFTHAILWALKLMSFSPLSTTETQKETKALRVCLQPSWNHASSFLSDGAWIANPFGFLQHHDIRFQTLRSPSQGFLTEGHVVVTVNLKNIRVKTEHSRRTLGSDMRIINVEEVTRLSITSRLKERRVFGIAPKSRIRSFAGIANWLTKQYAETVSISLIFFTTLFVVQFKWRPWLCRRSVDGRLIIKHCLKEADLDEVFGHVCDIWEDGCLWITLFREFKKGDEKFQPISNNTIIVFCKLCKPDYSDVTYLGHLLVEKTTPCFELLACIELMAGLSTKTEYNLYLEEARFGIRDVTGSQSSLSEVQNKNWVHSLRDHFCRSDFTLVRLSF